MEGFFVDGKLLGYAMLCVDSAHDYALIDYLGVLRELRNSGMGTKLLDLVKAHCSGYRGVLAEVEAPTGRSTMEDTVIMRRLAFYKRAGFVRLPYDMSLFGVRYRTLVYPLSGALPTERALAAHQRLYHGQFSPKCYERYVQLPLGKEPLRPFSPWAEG
jgi:ribosomal protein S18 acetylase RimI-like enzyme